MIPSNIDLTNKGLKKSSILSKNSEHGLIIGELFRARTLAHIAHLNTTSFAEHKALDTFYNDILDLTDTLAETTFGLYGRVSIVTDACALAPNFISYLKELRSKILSYRESISDTNIQNILDEILSLIDHTNYLLTLK